MFLLSLHVEASAARLLNEMNLERILDSPPRPLPLLGHAVWFLRDKLGFLERCAQLDRDVVELNIGGPVWLLRHPDDLFHVLVRNDSNYEKTRRLTSERGRRLHGNGLLTSTGERHARLRRLLQPIYRRALSEMFPDVVTRQTRRMLGTWHDGGEVDVYGEMMTLTRRAIASTVFGRDFCDEDDRIDRAIADLRTYTEYVYGSLLPWPEHLPTAATRHYREAARTIDEAVSHALASRRNAGASQDDMLVMLAAARFDDNGTGLTDREIIDEVITLFSAGYETVGVALAWSCFLLSCHEQVAQRLYSEVDRWQRETVCRTPAATGVVEGLEFTSMVVAESMRLYPPTWLFVRMARAADLLPSGTRIRAGAKLYVCPYILHRDPRFHPDPQRFNPLRFAPDQAAGRPRMAYLPFGVGSHACIGQYMAKWETAVILALVAQKFRLELVPDQDLRPQPEVILRPRHGLRMRVLART